MLDKIKQIFTDIKYTITDEYYTNPKLRLFVIGCGGLLVIGSIVNLVLSTECS